MNSTKGKARRLKARLVGINSWLLGAIAIVLAFAFGAPWFLTPWIGAAAFFSWRIFKDDLVNLRVDHWNLLGLAGSALGMWVFDANLSLSLIRGAIFFLIGWAMFQIFEGEIGGGDVRLTALAAVFLNTIQMLSAISLAAFVGMAIAAKYRVKKVPFASLLIVSFWLSFWIVRF